MNNLLEVVLGITLILGTLVIVFVSMDIPGGLGLIFRLILLGGWFWWKGFEALLGLVALEFISGGVFITNPLGRYFSERKKL